MKKRLFYIVSAVWLCSACQSEKAEDVIPADGAPVYLSASVETSVDSRVPYLSSPNPTPGEVLHAAVWATTEDAYIGRGLNGKNSGNQVDIHGSADFNDGQPKLLNDAVYPHPEGNETIPVDFIGLHPKEGWSTQGNEGKIAEFTFDGSDDVMFAPEETGNYAKDNTENILDLRFKHLLTWLKFKIKAENDNVAKSWGKVLEMKISSGNKVSIDLMEEYSFESCVEFSGGNGYLSLYKVDSDEVFPATNGFELTHTGNFREEAYVLCEPVLATAENLADYTLYIKSERREVSLPIDLKRNNTTFFEGSTRAKHFTLNLTFMVGSAVMIQAEATDWLWGSSLDKDMDF